MSFLALKLLYSGGLPLSGTFSSCIGYRYNTEFIFIGCSMEYQGTDAPLFLFIYTHFH